jgi:putative colanic acid biosynthesis acetyltransferase WcaF
MIAMNSEEGNFRVRLDRFTGGGLDRGRSYSWEVAWYLVKCAFFLSPLPWPITFKAWLLRLFGAEIGVGFSIKPRVNIHFPWKLRVGDHCWIGEGCEILNMEPFTMGSNSALAHFVYVAAAGHDIQDPSMEYANRPVELGEGSWVGTRAYLGPGTVVGKYAIVGAGAVVVKHVPDETVVGGVPAKVIGRREIRDGVEAVRPQGHLEQGE